MFLNIIFISILIILFLYFKNINYKELFVSKNNIYTKKKIAFMFLTINDIKQFSIWERFFENYDGYYNIYVHPKYPENVESFFKNYIIKDLVYTRWGDVSLVNATNKLIHAALSDINNTKLILVSGSCIPIKSFKYIYNKLLSNNNSWFNYYLPDLIQGSKKHYSRINLLHNPIKKCAIIHEQWMILDRYHANLLDNNTHLIKHFKIPDLIPDEMYYLTTLKYLDKNIFDYLQYPMNSRKGYLKHNRINYAKWYDKKTKIWQIYHPFTFNKMNKYDINILKNSNALFARKFSQKSDIGKYWDLIVK